MKKLFGLNLLLAVFFLFWAGASADSSKSIGDSAMSAHPEITEQEKLLPCFECHREATPEIYEEWFNSTHGIGMVKCYQCHGTYENLKIEPEASTCMVCHADQIEKCPQDKKCWSCHKPHTFKRTTK